MVRKLTRKKGVDVVFEHVGTDTFPGSMLALKRGGRLVTCGSTSGVSATINLMQLFQQQLKILGSFGCRMENMANAMQKMAAGLVAPVIDAEVGFAGIDGALKRLEGRDVFGKIILRVGSPQSPGPYKRSKVPQVFLVPRNIVPPAGQSLADRPLRHGWPLAA